MAHYAKIETIKKNIMEGNEVVAQETIENLVTEVIVANKDYVDTLEGTWVQTSYHTKEGKHLEGGEPLRKNFAGVGYTYDSSRDAFIPPKPFDSWVLNEDTCTWYPPTEMPIDDKKYRWIEESKTWQIAESGV